VTEAIRVRHRDFSLESLKTPELPAFLGLAVLAIPTLISVAVKSWTTDQGQYGVVVLALGIWLLIRDRGRASGLAKPGSPILTGLMIALGAELYVVSRLADQYIAESLALAWISLAVVYGLYGAAWMRALWFPLAFLLLAIPAPFSLTFPITSHLRTWISILAVQLLQLCNLDVVRDGLNIDIDQYTLVIAEACSGMNSLVSLSAVGVLYLHIRRDAGPLQMLAMGAPIVLFAILGNFVRVVALVVFTHLFGDIFTQSILHEATGVITFTVALLGVVALDEAIYSGPRLWALRPKPRRRRS
jgi:exosortase